MGSSKKHKKHKEKKSQHEENGASEQRPLKLVLKVGSSTATASATSSPVRQERQENVDSKPSHESKHAANEGEAPPKLTLAYGQDPQTGEITVHHSSSKKLKKKKSKKKHHKRCHRHSHHDHHDHHHHRHHRRSHHSSSKSSSAHHDSSTATIPGGSAIPAPVVSSQTISQPPMPDIRSPPRPSSYTGREGKSQFQHFLSHLLKQLQRRDPQEFFAWPVTDLIAPGYSSIIGKPMDFSTMKKKIDQHHYESLSKLRSDVKLMCDNAMTYNRPDTIYHKAARKLWRYAKDKIFNREAISEFAKFFPGLGTSELGFSHSEPVAMEVDQNKKEGDLQYPAFKDESVSTKDGAEPVKEEMNEEELTAEEVLTQAKKAAQAAADRLTLERPKGAHLSFLRQRQDGTTTLGILGNASEERIVNLEAMVGKLNDGIPSLPPFKEDESNFVKPVQSLDVPPFSSYLPSIDSSHSSLSTEDTSLLLSAYGEDDLGIQYAQSLLQFSADSDFALHMVDSLLDVLTHGQHMKVLKSIKDDKEKSSGDNGTLPPAEEMPDEIQTQLNEASTLLTDLRAVQYKRLGSSTQVINPSKEETKLAHTLSNKLCELIANYAAPGDIADVRGVRKAMGVQVKFD